MMKKIISTFIFVLAIGCGMGVGYGATHMASGAYKTLVAYASELKTNLRVETISSAEIAQGGPASDVIESDFNQDDQTLEQYFKNFDINTNKKVPKITAVSYLVADLETGKILASKSINQQLPIASVTKLMTAIVADETLGLDTQTMITENAIDTYGTQGNLKKGEAYSVLQLFYPLLLESSNDAAEALAYTKDRARFIADMNGKASSLGLTNTAYEDASGLSPHNVSTVSDLFKLTQYISKYRAYLLDISTEDKKALGKKTWLSNSRFKTDPDYEGGKNGYTDEALKTQVVLFDEKFGDDERTIAYIVLHSTDVGSDIKMLRQYVDTAVSYK
jgi:D-alanyl-D-alanine carboxypeptidase